MRLLPPGQSIGPEAVCAARVEAADGVGGDFYHLFRLGDSRVMTARELAEANPIAGQGNASAVFAVELVQSAFGKKIL